MSSDYTPGHGPTETDESNAFTYATMNQHRTLCLSDPVNYVWKEDLVVGYPCPEGLTCYSGKCEFSKPGCQNYSNLQLFDCKRKDVPCSFNGSQETCSMCDFHLVGNGPGGTACPQNDGSPLLTDADKAALKENAVSCRPGDAKLLPPPGSPPLPLDPCRQELGNDPNTQRKPCPGLPDTRVPYTVNSTPIPCSCDDDCNSMMWDIVYKSL